MNVFIVHAHPEPRSLNASLTQVAIDTLTRLGHATEVSDLYAMKWKAIADRQDFPSLGDSERLFYNRASQHAFPARSQADDVTAEQQKLLWADAVIFQFPLWWYSLPAILKGWVERVFAYGLAYGVGKHEGEHWGGRFGEGRLLGRRAMLSLTIGGRQPHYSRRGVNGSLDDVLWNIQHGIVFYPEWRCCLPSRSTKPIGSRQTIGRKRQRRIGPASMDCSPTRRSISPTEWRSL